MYLTFKGKVSQNHQEYAPRHLPALFHLPLIILEFKVLCNTDSPVFRNLPLKQSDHYSTHHEFLLNSILLHGTNASFLPAKFSSLGPPHALPVLETLLQPLQVFLLKEVHINHLTFIYLSWDIYCFQPYLAISNRSGKGQNTH